MEIYQQNITIKQWAEDDRPREKFMLKGRHALSDAELLALLLGTGTHGESAVDLAKRILQSKGDNLLELSRVSVAELIKNFKGIGKAKDITLVAALELGNRKRGSEALQKQKISTSRDAFEYLRSFIGDSPYEEFWILVLNRANKILQKCCISEGGITGTVADPKKIFKIALENNAASVILCHNHPSGNTRPSDSDIQLTRKLRDAGNMLDLPVIDHIIIGDENYFSFADEGAF
jgi:DNA repair protein RadC